MQNQKDVQIDSKKVTSGDVFIAIGDVDLEKRIQDAISRGAAEIVLENEEQVTISRGVAVRYVNDIRSEAALLAAELYPESPPHCVAVTGTNGKSSVVHFFNSILTNIGKNAASLGTSGLFVGPNKSTEIDVPSLTTPDPISLHKILQHLKRKRVEFLAFELSSHAIDQKRADYVDLQAAAVTNISSDHLDYHKTVADYRDTKYDLFRRILKKNRSAVVSKDFEDLYGDIKRIKGNDILSFGFDERNDISASNVRQLPMRTAFDLKLFDRKFKDIEVNAIGGLMVHNLLCAAALVSSLGIRDDEIAAGMQDVRGPDGRIEYIGSHNGGSIFIDYAHTTEAFRKALELFKSLAKERLIVLFGCGGDRDKSKRSQMGSLASEIADVVIVTDDNPRTEDPELIRREIMAECKKAIERGDRRDAIAEGVGMLKTGDILAIIGKGAENIQIYKDNILNFSDKEEILKLIK